MLKKMLLVVPSYMNYYDDLSKAFSANFEVFVIIDDDSKVLKKIACFTEDFFDIILVIRGYSLSKIQYQIKNFKAERKILYEWDSLKNFNYSPYIYLFDTVRTFDFKDAKDYNFEYLPLFYTKKELKQERNIDMLFVGIWHSDRYQLLINFYQLLVKAHKKVYFKLYYKWYFYIPFVILRKIKTFRFYSPRIISRQRIENLYNSSRTVLDLSHPEQNGFTMRTIEALGNGCKLVTTNKNIQSALFYNENNVFVFDRVKEIDRELLFKFLNKPFVENSEIEKYEINNWVKEVLK